MSPRAVVFVSCKVEGICSLHGNSESICFCRRIAQNAVKGKEQTIDVKTPQHWS